MDQANPFIIGSDIPVELFCDREAEVKLLHKHIANGRNVVLSSPRRLGKSGLIHHFFKLSKTKKKYTEKKIDLYIPQIQPNFPVYIKEAKSKFSEEIQ